VPCLLHRDGALLAAVSVLFEQVLNSLLPLSCGPGWLPCWLNGLVLVRSQTHQVGLGLSALQLAARLVEDDSLQGRRAGARSGRRVHLLLLFSFPLLAEFLGAEGGGGLARIVLLVVEGGVG